MNVVLIPAFNRPEFLHLCLEHILKNPDYDENHYVINLDKGYRRQNIEVVQNFRKHFNSIETRTIKGNVNGTAKQSYALLNGYRYAQAKSSGLVYMLEEDIMVSNQFFRWHKAVHQAEPNIYCSIATRNNNTRFPQVNDPRQYYLFKGDYQSLGVCFKKDMLNLVLAHANNDYWQNPFHYCKRHWPTSPIANQFVEQDGLHRRIVIEKNLDVAFSLHGFAFHAGYYGYHRVVRETGNLEQKIAKIRATAFDPQTLRAKIQANGHPLAYYYDSEPINLNITWDGTLELQS
jgi:hypothetical protein